MRLLAPDCQEFSPPGNGSIFLVNLLIAQMTNTYEKIKERSKVYRLFQRVSLIVEYKDNRGPP